VTADEIRAVKIPARFALGDQLLTLQLMREIAAQLAELNESRNPKSQTFHGFGKTADGEWVYLMTDGRLNPMSQGIARQLLEQLTEEGKP
jgi:hypothetical protein